MARNSATGVAEWRRRIAGAAQDSQPGLLRLGIAAALFVAGAAVAAVALIAIKPVAPATGSGPAIEASAADFTAPQLSAIPDGPEGDAIKRGLAIFHDPRTNAGQFAGNAMACKNCHLDDGRRPGSSPMWAAWVSYPQYRKKTHSINTMEDRIRGCFLYSMNARNSPSGGPPPDDSDVYRDLEAYFHWLANGASTGTKLKGANYPTPALPQAGYDPSRGAKIFEATCTACHGPDGQGATQPDGKVVYPPLWGPRSYNWGAGMARIDLAAGFIKGNMPFDHPGTLTDGQAWDLAAFVDSHERPKDPRQTGSVADNAKTNFAGQQTYYGKLVGGKLLGGGVVGQR